jgi:tetratricopeptide (TPR) repeat protein
MTDDSKNQRPSTAPCSATLDEDSKPTSTLSALRAELDRLPDSEYKKASLLALSVLRRVRSGLDGHPDLLDAIRKVRDYGPARTHPLHVVATIARLPEWYQAQGERSLAIGRYEEALQAFDRVLQLKPSDPRIMASRAGALVQLGRHAEAEEALRCAVDLEPDVATHHSLRGEILRKLGRHQEALAELDRALELAPQDAWTIATKALVLLSLGRHDDGTHLLRYAIELHPQLWWAQRSLATLLVERGRKEEALRVMAVALTQATAPLDYLLHSGRLLRQLESLDASLGALERAVAMEPNSAPAQAQLGETLRLLGRNDDALRALDRSLAIEPGNSWARATKGQVLATEGRLAEALRLVQEAVNSQPTLFWAYTLLGDVLTRLGRHQEALEAYERAFSAMPSDPATAQARAAALWATDRCSEAIEALEHAKTLEGADLAWICGFKGQCLVLAGEYNSALDAIGEAIAHDGSVPWLYELKGWTLLRRTQPVGRADDRASQSRAAYEHGLRIDPDNAVLWHAGLGEAYWFDRRFEDARVSFRAGVAAASPRLSKLQSYLVACVAWCHYRLDEFEDAVRLTIDAISCDRDDLSSRFDLAIALMSNRQYALALQEYQRSLDDAAKRHPARTRGLLLVAFNDLEDARATKPYLRDIQEVAIARKLLSERIEQPAPRLVHPARGEGTNSVWTPVPGAP